MACHASFSNDKVLFVLTCRFSGRATPCHGRLFNHKVLARHAMPASHIVSTVLVFPLFVLKQLNMRMFVYVCGFLFSCSVLLDLICYYSMILAVLLVSPVHEDWNTYCKATVRKRRTQTQSPLRSNAQSCVIGHLSDKLKQQAGLANGIVLQNIAEQ